jgi:hypothetical protein
VAAAPDLLVAAGLLVAAVVAVLARRAYLQFPDVIPREKTVLDERAYAAVRAGIVLGGALGGVGGVVAVLDTVGTIVALRPGDGGVVEDLAVAVPEWAAEAGLLAGVAVLLASGLVVVVAQFRARREAD